MARVRRRSDPSFRTGRPGRHRAAGALPQPARHGVPIAQISALQRSAGNRAASGYVSGLGAGGRGRSGTAFGIRPLVVNRFEADEHEWLGDAGSGGKTVPLGSGYSLTFGEMVAMAGDHFSSIDQMRAFATRTGPGPGGVDELEYVRRVDIHGEDTPPEFTKPDTFDPADPAWRRRHLGARAAEAAKKRYYALAGQNQSHFLQPRGVRSPLADPAMSLVVAELLRDAGIDAKDVLEGSAANYRNYHVRAIKEAVLLGQTDADVGPAFAVEAFAAHYLTDSFAGGHVQTERISINEHWNSRVPMFTENLIGYISETMAHAYAATVTVGPLQLRPDVAYHFGARSAVEGALASKGTFTFGDLVSGAVHDVANEQGLKAGADTGMMSEIVTLFGDGNLGKGDEERLAIEAVRRGVDDVQAAYDAAKKTPKPSVTTVLASLAPDGVFSPEEMLPQSYPADEPPMWKHDTVDELFADPRMVEALTLFGNEKAGELETAAEELGDEKKERLFKAHVVQPFRDRPVQLLRDVLAWTPDTGGGVFEHNTDDNALDYVDAARDAGGMESLSLGQRRRLIDDLLDGATVGGDEDAIVQLLTSAGDSDARSLINEFGWERLHDEIDDWVGNDFADAFPKSSYGR